MGFELTLFKDGLQNALVETQAVGKVMKCNDLTAQYGLALTETQAIALVQTRSVTLQETGRIEFGGGVIDKIISAFCDSPYVSTHDYEKTLHELIQIFYHCKNESLDMVSDDDLIASMKESFDGVCQGSLELLAGRELEQFSRNFRYGYDTSDADDTECVNEEDEDGLS